MKIRRVVVGNDEQGRSVFLSDEVAPNSHDFEFMPGNAHARIWYVPGPVTTQVPGTEPTSNTGPLLPGPGGASFVISQFPPATVVEDPGFDGAKAAEEASTYAPDLIAVMEPDGMHRTATVDYGIVLDGEIWLEVDGGEERLLAVGDTIVQLGGRHGWRNKSDRPATVAFVLTGAHDGAAPPTAGSS